MKDVDPFETACRTVAGRYRARPDRYYVHAKLRVDPVGRALHDLGAVEPYGALVDVACGRGQISLLLVATGVASSVCGFDWDRAKVAHANEAATEFSDTLFEYADVRDLALPSADTVLLIDVLHYLTVDEQDDLLARAAAAARRRVIVRDLDPDDGARSLFTRACEWIGTATGYNRGARVSPRSFTDLTEVLETHGLEVRRQACAAKGMSNSLLIGTHVSV